MLIKQWPFSYYSQRSLLHLGLMIQILLPQGIKNRSIKSFRILGFLSRGISLMLFSNDQRQLKELFSRKSVVTHLRMLFMRCHRLENYQEIVIEEYEEE